MNYLTFNKNTKLRVPEVIFKGKKETSQRVSKRAIYSRCNSK